MPAYGTVDIDGVRVQILQQGLTHRLDLRAEVRVRELHEEEVVIGLRSRGGCSRESSWLTPRRDYPA